MRFLIARDLSVGNRNPGTPIFCNPEKRCLSRRRTCKHLTSCFAKSFLELETAAMSKRTREKERKAQSLEQLAKPDEISIGRRCRSALKSGSDAILVQSWYLRYFCGNR